MNNFKFAFSFLFIWLIPLMARGNDFVCNPWMTAYVGDEAPVQSEDAFGISFNQNTLVIGHVEYLMLSQSDTSYRKGPASAMVYHYDLGWP